jgi:hypothetical protein
MNTIICGELRFGIFLLRWGREEVYARAGQLDAIYDLEILSIMAPMIIGATILLLGIGAWAAIRPKGT